jgi:hypothetical protein
MKYLIIGAIVFASCVPALAQTDQSPGISGATVPVTRSDGVTVKQPAPDSTPKPLPNAQTPAEIAADQEIRKQADDDVTSYAQRVSDSCDTDLKARIDWTTVSPLQTHRYSPADSCGAALQAIEEICATSAGRERVEKEIRSVICTNGAQPSIEIHANTLVYSVDWQDPMPGARVYAWLASHL